MCKVIFNKNEAYSTKDAARMIQEQLPDRWVSFDSCFVCISQQFSKLNLIPINGQKKRRVFSGSDCQKVFEHYYNLENGTRDTRGQQSIFTSKMNHSLRISDEAYRVAKKRSDISGKTIIQIIEDAVLEYDANHPISKYEGWTREDLIKALEGRDIEEEQV